MKKLLLIALIMLSTTCAIAKEIKHYLVGGPSSVFYDLDTFKYDEKRDEISIDVLYGFDYKFEKNIDSPYDKNKIRYLIYSTKYHPDTNKLDIAYKGFVSACAEITPDEIYYTEEKFYYENKTKSLPELKKYTKEFKNSMGNNNYKNDVMDEIFSAYRKDKLYELQYIIKLFGY